MTLETGIEAAFNNLVFMADDLITVQTAAILAKELGISFDPIDFDH